MQETIKDLIAIIRPVLELVITIAVPLIALRVNTWLGTKDEKDRTEIEKLLRDAIHASAQNALAYALQKKGIPITDLTSPNNGVTSEVVKMAVDYVKDKNPDALRKLGVDDGNLKDIVTSKLPTLR